MKRYYIILFFLLAIGFSLSATPPSVEQVYYETPIEKKSFNKKDWEKAKEGIDYTPKEKKEKKKETVRGTNNGGGNGTVAPTRNRRNWNGIDGAGSFFSGLFKVLLVILVVLLLGALAYRLTGGQFETIAEKKAEKGPAIGSIDIKKVEANLHKSDLEKLLDKSIADKEYMTAVRLYYLWAIKEMSNRRLIKWKRDKTNRDYIRELRKSNPGLHPPFRQVTRIFERVWYGTQDQLSQADFYKIEATLKGFVDKVRK